MSITDVNYVANRLSLRPPQRESLSILNRLCDIVDFQKDNITADMLNTIKSEYPFVEDFERDFPSLCFALATGVGKTRLMGAFISYLYRSQGIRHFFVLAPNLTIYNKLIADFTPGNPKYVFQGIAEFSVQAPEIITGDNYESGRGIRQAAEGRMLQRDMFSGPVHINIFNISKINSEVRGGNAPRIKRLSEYIGESYFEYLSKLDDLVLLMDESHRYRATAGVKAINELKPILGIELTATPQVMQANKVVPFKNVIYSYPLHKALEDGFVKAPAVATRENFNKDNYDEAALEILKLEDGIRIHEETKVQLDVFARENNVKRVKPFVLVVAEDTSHASRIKTIIEGLDFFGGQYKGKVAEVHSNQRGEEKDENVQKLLSVENPDDPTEIVIHVDQLKEGWDVTNLYTIVPLRAFNSRTLIEQAIGRGLRLPYGKRVGVAAVDQLTIVSHDKFQDIIDEANRGDSILKIGLVLIGKDIPDTRSKAVTIPTNFEQAILGTTPQPVPGATPATATVQKPLFNTEGERKAAQATLDVIKLFERLKSSQELNTPEVQKQIIEQVTKAIQPTQLEIPEVTEKIDVKQVVAATTQKYVELSLDIPRIVVVPSEDASYGFTPFDLDCKNIRLQPVSQEILVQNLQTNERYRLHDSGNSAREQRLEDYLVRSLIDFDDISYDDHSQLLYKLSGQMVAHLHSYLDEEGVLNVLLNHNKQLVDAIYAQMQEKYFEQATSYEVKITQGFTTLRSNHVLTAADEEVRPFRQPVDEKRKIREMLFGGFTRCIYPSQKFDSDSERRFAVLLENDTSNVLKWFKPGRGVFNIHYRSGIDEGNYEPDFVVETKTAKYLCEPKASNELQDPVVIAKSAAAATWCKHATQVSAKPWHYLLIPHDQIDESKTLDGLAARFTVTAK